MKRSILVALVALGAIITLQPVQISAQIFNGTPNDVEYLKFLAGSGQGSAYGVQVGPYSGQFEASPISGRAHTTLPFALYCVDYMHYASRSTGLVTLTSLSPNPDLTDPDLTGTNTRLQNYALYQRSAYLSSLFDSWDVEQSNLFTTYGVWFSKKQVWGGLHAAIWAFTTGPSYLLGSGRTADARDYFLGLNGGSSFSTAGWYVVSEKDNLGGHKSGQEFLMRTKVVEVPEPSSVLLMVTGLVLLVGAKRKRLVGVVDET